MITTEKRVWRDLPNAEKADFVTRFNEGQRGGAALSAEGQPEHVRTTLEQLVPYTLDLMPAGDRLLLVLVSHRGEDYGSWTAPYDITVTRDSYQVTDALDDETLATYVGRALLSDLRLPVGTLTIERAGPRSQQITATVGGAGTFLITVTKPNYAAAPGAGQPDEDAPENNCAAGTCDCAKNP